VKQTWAHPHLGAQRLDWELAVWASGGGRSYAAAGCPAAGGEAGVKLRGSWCCSWWCCWLVLLVLLLAGGADAGSPEAVGDTGGSVDEGTAVAAAAGKDFGFPAVAG